jgi:cell division protein FtsL
VTRSRASKRTEFHTVKRIDNSRLARPIASDRLREMARLILLGAMLAAAALIYAWQHFEYLQLRYRVESLKSERSQASELNQQLKLEMAGLRAPSRIDEIARRQLRLTAPIPGQVAPLDQPVEPVVAQARPSGSFRVQ